MFAGGRGGGGCCGARQCNTTVLHGCVMHRWDAAGKWADAARYCRLSGEFVSSVSDFCFFGVRISVFLDDPTLGFVIGIGFDVMMLLLI